MACDLGTVSTRTRQDVVCVKMHITRDGRKDPVELYCNLALDSVTDVQDRWETRKQGRQFLWEPRGYHSSVAEVLTVALNRIRTVSGGQFDWGGRL